MSIVISQGYFKQSMEGEVKKQEEKITKIARKKPKSKLQKRQEEQKKQILDVDALEQDSNHSESSSGWSSEVVEPAIKTMSFRSKRGTRMKQLIKGKYKKDKFWEKYQNYFGGDLNQPDNSEDQEDYQASSSGRDEFDSDFDLTDSYVGKRGRKKGTKVKRRKKPISKANQEKQENPNASKGRRGRKKKGGEPQEILQKQEHGQLLKEEKNQSPQNKNQANQGEIELQLNN